MSQLNMSHENTEACYNSNRNLKQGIDDDGKFVQDNEVKPELVGSFSPLQWIALALFSGFLIALNYEIKSTIAQYGFEWRYLQSPGSCIVNIITFIVLSSRYNQKASEDSESLIRHNVQDGSCYNFDWFKQIYLTPVLSEDPSEHAPKYRIEVSRILWTVFLVFLNLITYWAQVEAYYYAVTIKLNIGVLSWFFSLKPIMSGILYYFMLGYTLKKTDIAGIILAIGSVLILTLANQIQHIRHRKFTIKIWQKYRINIILLKRYCCSKLIMIF